MKVLCLKRIARTSDGTFGVLLAEGGIPMCVTCELPWKQNQTGISHIPIGEYIAQLVMSPKRGYKVYELQNVPNRTAVEIHIGNSIYDIEGCILLGRAFGVVETKDNGEINGIQDSTLAFNKFMAILVNDEVFKLVIMEC